MSPGGALFVLVLGTVLRGTAAVILPAMLCSHVGGWTDREYVHAAALLALGFVALDPPMSAMLLLAAVLWFNGLIVRARPDAPPPPAAVWRRVPDLRHPAAARAA